MTPQNKKILDAFEKSFFSPPLKKNEVAYTTATEAMIAERERAKRKVIRHYLLKALEAKDRQFEEAIKDVALKNDDLTRW